MKNNINNDIDFKLSQLTERLEHLDITYRRESNQIREEIEKIRTDRNQVNTVPVLNNPNHILRIGSTVRVTNTYKGLKGTIGKVTKINIDGYWVWFIAKNGNKYRRASANLQVLEHDFQYYQSTAK